MSSIASALGLQAPSASIPENLDPRVEKPVFAINPAGYDPRDDLPAHRHRYADHARHLISTICCRSATCWRHAEWVPVNAAKERRFFPSNRSYKQCRDDLLTRETILCDRTYTPGEKSMHYKLGPRFQGSRSQFYPLTDPDLVRKIRDHRAMAGSRQPPTDPVLRYLFTGLSRLTIDYDAALQVLLDSDDFHIFDETAIQHIRDQQWRWSHDRFGRFHTNLSNLRSTMRPFLICDGNRSLVNLDIANSQPLFFAIRLRARYAGRPMPPDVTKYVELVQEGQFYEHLMDRAGVRDRSERPRFKKQILVVFFCEIKHMETKAAMAFRAEFPNVFAAIIEAKRDRYEALAWDLQRTESGLIIRSVAARCRAELPDAFVGTIYDSILIVPELVEAVRRIMLEEFARADLRPHIRIEELARPEAARRVHQPRRTSCC